MVRGVKDGHEFCIFSSGICEIGRKPRFGGYSADDGAHPALKPRFLACTLAGLVYGTLLAWLSSGAAGYDGDSRPLSLVLMFMVGFPVSLPLCGFDGYFINQAYSWEWTDLPASYHNGAASFSFADGHAETHRWRFASTKPPSQPDGAPLPLKLPKTGWGDFSWVLERMSIDRD